MDNITVRDLRRLLFGLDNQDMTVKELRDSLFTANNQDESLLESDVWQQLEAGVKSDNMDSTDPTVNLIALGNDLKESILGVMSLTDAINTLKYFEQVYNLTFVKDSSLYGGYYRHTESGNCYYIK